MHLKSKAAIEEHRAEALSLMRLAAHERIEDEKAFRHHPLYRTLQAECEAHAVKAPRLEASPTHN
jgi:hypothetical protein